MRFLRTAATSSVPIGRQARRTVTILATLICLANCGGPQELTRERAATLITDSRDFHAPVTLPLKKEIDLNVQEGPEGETEAEAVGRAVETYYQFNPQMDVLRQLGLIDARATVRRRSGENYRVWSFNVEPVLTEQGGRLTPGEQDMTLPLAHKELVEVTGIAKASDMIANAEYTWREVPTQVGRAFIPGSPEHQSLPVSLQQTLARRNQTKDYGKTRRGRAIFQLYDDGWRLSAIQ